MTKRLIIAAIVVALIVLVVLVAIANSTPETDTTE